MTDTTDMAGTHLVVDPDLITNVLFCAPCRCVIAAHHKLDGTMVGIIPDDDDVWSKYCRVDDDEIRRLLGGDEDD